MKALNIQPGGHLLTGADKQGVLLGERVGRPAWTSKSATRLPCSTTRRTPWSGIFKSPSGLRERQHGGVAAGFAAVHGPQGPGERLRHRGRSSRRQGRDRADLRRLSRPWAPNIEATPTAEFVNSTTEIRFIRAMAWITSAIAMIIGAVGMLNTMIMSVFERTREIGILRAIGWRTLARGADDPDGIGAAEPRRRRGRHRWRPSR